MNAVLSALAAAIVSNLIWVIYYNRSTETLIRENNLLQETYLNYHKRAYREKADAYTYGYKDGYKACESEDESEEKGDEWLGLDMDALLKEWKADPEMTLNIYPFENRPWGKD